MGVDLGGLGVEDMEDLNWHFFCIPANSDIIGYLLGIAVDAVIDKDELMGGEVVKVGDLVDAGGNCVGDGKLVHKNCSISLITFEIITNTSLLSSLLSSLVGHDE